MGGVDSVTDINTTKRVTDGMQDTDMKRKPPKHENQSSYIT